MTVALDDCRSVVLRAFALDWQLLSRGCTSLLSCNFKNLTIIGWLLGPFGQSLL